MSVHRIVEVRCNGQIGAAECPDSAAWSDSGTAADLRQRMARDGWDTGLRFGNDRCPKCRSYRPIGSAS